MLELACLYYEVHRRFFTSPLATYNEAMGEVNSMAKALGYTINDLARIVACAGGRYTHPTKVRENLRRVKA
jgi:hypothetical protein